MGAGVYYTFEVIVSERDWRTGYGVTEEEARQDVKATFPEVIEVLEANEPPE